MRRQQDLVASSPSAICQSLRSRGPGVYVILRSDGGETDSLLESQAGRHKGKDPTTSIEQLRSRWVKFSEVVYTQIPHWE